MGLNLVFVLLFRSVDCGPLKFRPDRQESWSNFGFRPADERSILWASSVENKFGINVLSSTAGTCKSVKFGWLGWVQSGSVFMSSSQNTSVHLKCFISLKWSVTSSPVRLDLLHWHVFKINFFIGTYCHLEMIRVIQYFHFCNRFAFNFMLLMKCQFSSWVIKGKSCNATTFC